MIRLLERGDNKVVFLNENEFTRFEFDKVERLVTLYSKNQYGEEEELEEYENIAEVDYINDNQIYKSIYNVFDFRDTDFVK